MRTFFTRFLGALLVLNLLGSTAATAQAVVPETAVRQIWQQIDYVGVDYGGAVAHGQVASASEYAEMREFVGNALTGARGFRHWTAEQTPFCSWIARASTFFIDRHLSQRVEFQSMK